MPAAFLGAPVRRLEDPRLLRGQASFVEDLALPRMLHVAFVRSEYPHARLRGLDCAAAQAMRGVVAIVDAQALGPTPVPRIHATVTHPALRPCAQPILADGTLRYLGEPIAAVVAGDRLTAEDGRAAVQVDAEPLDPVSSAEAAVAEGAPLLHPELGDNLAGRFEVLVGDAEAQFARAEHVVSGRFYVQRYTGMP